MALLGGTEEIGALTPIEIALIRVLSAPISSQACLQILGPEIEGRNSRHRSLPLLGAMKRFLVEEGGGEIEPKLRLPRVTLGLG